METKFANRVFSWSNNQDNLIFVVIDRVLSSIDWDMHLPLTTLCALPTVGSDHTPSYKILVLGVIRWANLFGLKNDG